MRNEAQTRAELIDPALELSGWGHNFTQGSRVAREVVFADGRKIVGGVRGKQKIADYILSYKNQQLAIIEAKKEGAEVTQGLEQAKEYAQILQVRFVYSTNGRGVYEFDLQTGRGELINKFPAPSELYQKAFGQREELKERVLAEPFHRSHYEPRYYQENAIMAALEAIAEGKDRVLLTLATGTGKTFIAFQITWKLFNARWNRRGDSKRPRVLFLADRNVLAGQAMGDFNPLEKDLVRVNGEEIRKRNGKIPTNANIFFSIYQAMLGGGEQPYYLDYPPDFFDLVIIDECHRGGAKNESQWREILNYFQSAVHLGLTATPKRDVNTDTYKYFGEPVYIYSLKTGIEDGFLTPFKVKKISTTLDELIWRPGDEIVEGEMEKDFYKKEDFNRIIIAPEREEELVKIMLSNINQQEKTIVFCRDESHALLVRDLINKYKASNDPNYCVRVTASEGILGDHFLEQFQDNDKTIPAILTTSQKLSTGVDARNVRNIVLMRPVGSMVEFKQIVGRGIRVFEGKDFFTILDFYDNTKHFADSEWDGEPEEVIETGKIFKKGKKETKLDFDGLVNDSLDETPEPVKKLRVRLSPERIIEIDHMVETIYFDGQGKPVNAEEFLRSLFNSLPDFFRSEEDLRRIWANPETRKELLVKLAERGFDQEKLETLQKLVKAEDSDVFDVLQFIAFAKEMKTRKERVIGVNFGQIRNLSEGEEEFLLFVLEKYEEEGHQELNDLTALLNLKYGNVFVATQMGGVDKLREDFYFLQKEIYQG